MKNYPGGWLSLLLPFIVFGVLLAVWPIRSYFEARVYNKLTGASVTTWDAMWVELRVEGGR